MDISKMSEQEKSILLTRLMGWRKEWADILVDSNDVGIGYRVKEGESMPNLYVLANMPLAWMVLNWVAQSQMGAAFDVWWSSELSIHQLRYMPARAQGLWLDKILELAVEAGICSKMSGNC